LDYRYYSGS